MDLVFDGGSRAPHPNPNRKQPPRRRNEKAGDSCTRRGRTATVWMTTGKTKNTKAKRPSTGGEGENHENTGSTAQAPAARLRFCGPSPTKTEPSRFCLMPLAHYGCPMGEKTLSNGQQVYMPNMAKNMAKKCRNMPQIGRKSSKWHQFWPTGLFFGRFGPSRSF